MTVLEKLTGGSELGAGGAGGDATVLDSAGVFVVSAAVGVDDDAADEGTAILVEGVAVTETATLFDAEEDG